jgi:hypothetical protein
MEKLKMEEETLGSKLANIDATSWLPKWLFSSKLALHVNGIITPFHPK